MGQTLTRTVKTRTRTRKKENKTSEPRKVAVRKPKK